MALEIKDPPKPWIPKIQINVIIHDMTKKVYNGTKKGVQSMAKRYILKPTKNLLKGFKKKSVKYVKNIWKAFSPPKNDETDKKIDQTGSDRKI